MRACVCVAVVVSMCVCVSLALLLTRCWGDKAVITFASFRHTAAAEKAATATTKTAALCAAARAAAAKDTEGHTHVNSSHTHTRTFPTRMVKAIKCLVFYSSIPFMLLLSMTASEPNHIPTHLDTETGASVCVCVHGKTAINFIL